MKSVRNLTCCQSESGLLAIIWLYRAMTKINFKNQKIKTTATILGTVIIGLMMLSPTTVLPNVSGISGRLSMAPFDDPRVPLQASVLEEQVQEQLKSHPGWIGFVSWNKTSAKIDYIGPPGSSPFAVKNTYNP